MTTVPIAAFMMALLASCGSGLNGTYVPKNEAAKQSNFAKFEFKRKTVKVYMGVLGMTMPMAYEYRYSVKGSTVSFEAGMPGMAGMVEFTYNKERQELSLLTGMFGGAMDEFAPVWCNEKTCGLHGYSDEPVKKRSFVDWLKGLFGSDATTPTEPDITPPPILPDGIFLDKTTLEFKKKGEGEQLTATVFPPEVSEENKQVSWLSSNETVAKVDTAGIVTAVANGHAIIKANTINGLSDSCLVQVKIPIIPIDSLPAQLNDLLNKIGKSDDNATDKIRNMLGNNLPVEGAANISNVQQLITDVSIGNRYKVTRVNRNDDGKLVSITVSKQ